MRKEEFFYDSRDGKSRIHAVRYSPEEPEKVRCVLQIVHGMAEYVERYEEFARGPGTGNTGISANRIRLPWW